MELSRNLSWPFSRSRTHAFLVSFFLLGLFSYLSATLAGNSTTATAGASSPRILFSNSLYYFSPITSFTTRFISGNSPENQTNENPLSVEQTQQNYTETETKNLIDNLASCDIFDGKWVIDDSNPNPAYQPGSCPFIDDAFNCFKNGRPDSDYTRFRWKPNGCQIPRMEVKEMLEMLRGKRLVFVGDSLNRNMWESLVCALRDSLVDKNRVFEVSGRREFRTQGFYSFIFEDYNCSIDFIRAPFLVQEWKMSDMTGARRDTLRLDLVQKPPSKYHDADIIVFNTGHWWTHEKTSRGKDYYQEGDYVYSKLDMTEAYTKALRTWAQWVDANVDSSRTRVFFRGYSASHFKGGQWNSGGNCDGETQPITNDTYLLPYPRMMDILESVIKEMKTPVFYLNITRMTDYRKDGHPSIFRQPESQRRPGMFQDCSHWCLPGVPDVWNELLYAALLISRRP
ncbi:PMR5 N-terminal domain [Macleaya cordata]|uniref:PMR5 N-terminal domain n=1 Tax=Macleaya cordata TaxID=56857 RepID=A0A200PWG8_MACCD|nr:PMR5 N-terminal domain [Macleaya cordata]